MSWSGTVTCSHCYNRGHNKRKCPKLTREILDQYQLYERTAKRERTQGDQATADQYEGRSEYYRTEYMKRTKIDPATGEKVKNKTAKAARMKKITCGYCQASGHTRRVCEAVKADYQVYLVETKQVRKDLLTAVQEAGVGVGSMVPFPDRGYNADGKWGMYTRLNYITTYQWDSVDAHSRGLAISYVNHKNIHRMHDPYHRETIYFDRLLERMSEVGEDAPPPSLAGSVNPPDGWLDGGRSLKEAFPTTGNRHDKERPYEYRWPSDSKQEAIRSLGLEEHYPNMDRS
tara:strand:- start:601 stop:1461 length:861 start_codon:yes stop_codon:yes gene_type:complete